MPKANSFGAFLFFFQFTPVEPFGGAEDFDVSGTQIVYTAKDPSVDEASHTRQNVRCCPRITSSLSLLTWLVSGVYCSSERRSPSPRIDNRAPGCYPHSYFQPTGDRSSVDGIGHRWLRVRSGKAGRLRPRGVCEVLHHGGLGSIGVRGRGKPKRLTWLLLSTSTFALWNL